MPRQRKRKIDAAALPAPPPQVEGVIWGSQMRPRDREWLVPGMIPRDCLTMLEGRKGTGKSLVLAAIAASCTGGPLMPGWEGPRDGTVLWESSEDDWEPDILPRLVAAGGSGQRVGRIEVVEPDGQKRRIGLPSDLVYLGDRIRVTGATLLILDPFISLADRGIDCCTEQGARAYLDPLAELLRQARCTAILTRHLRKGTYGDPREQGYGHGAVANACRSLIRCDEHPHEPGINVLSVVTTSYGDRGAVQEFRIVKVPPRSARVKWLGTSSLTADQIAEGRGTAAERDEWADADKLLASMIGQRWVRVADIEKAALAAAVSSRMLRRAKERLGIPSRHREFGPGQFWEWGPPKGGWPPSLLPPERNGGYPQAPGPSRESRAPDTPKTPRDARRRSRPPVPPDPPLVPPVSPPEMQNECQSPPGGLQDPPPDDPTP